MFGNAAGPNYQHIPRNWVQKTQRPKGGRTPKGTNRKEDLAARRPEKKRGPGQTISVESFFPTALKYSCLSSYVSQLLTWVSQFSTQWLCLLVDLASWTLVLAVSQWVNATLGYVSEQETLLFFSVHRLLAFARSINTLLHAACCPLMKASERERPCIERPSQPTWEWARFSLTTTVQISFSCSTPTSVLSLKRVHFRPWIVRNYCGNSFHAEYVQAAVGHPERLGVGSRRRLACVTCVARSHPPQAS